MFTIENFGLKFYNSYRLDSFCPKAYFPESESELVGIYKSARSQCELPILIGGGYNIILSKKRYKENFIVIGHRYANIKLINHCMIECTSGVTTKIFSQFASDNSLTGAEVFYDIPSTIGGAIVMNAGANGEEIKDILKSVKYYDVNKDRIEELDIGELYFDYRDSGFQKDRNKIILSARFQLKYGDRKNIIQKMEEIKTARELKQPKTFPNAGSVFKRPKGYYVGPLIEELGLKGFCIGGAQVSTKHAGFIINRGNATGQDIIRLIHLIIDEVQRKYGVLLEIEQRII